MSKRNSWISFRAEEKEAFRIELAARMAGVSRSAFVRDNAVQAAERRLAEVRRPKPAGAADNGR